jgi:hypothetical protein
VLLFLVLRRGVIFRTTLYDQRHAEFPPPARGNSQSAGKRALIALFMVASFCAQARGATPEIGDTVRVKNEVTVEAGDASRKIEKGSKVFQDEIVVTDASSSAEFELLDQTKLAVGPSARVVLDKFVYDASVGSISIGMVKGAFRFITGSSPKTAYKINIPAATIGVRGTVFDGYVADDGETVILLHEGSVDVCPTPTTCQLHDRVCHIIHISRTGAVAELARWDGSVLHGIPVAQAFPFVGRKLAVDPVRRLSHPALIAGTCDFVQNAPSHGLQQAPVNLAAPNPAALGAFGLAPIVAVPLILSAFDDKSASP